MDGVLNVNKPEGISSFDAVRYIKKIAKTSKVGHTGTLDPAASGVLPICIGRATKIVDYIMNDIKTYSVELKLGVVTDTFDKEGKVISKCDVNCSDEEILSAILSFQGESEQLPPMYSAIKINGVRLYELARKGIEVQRELRSINIYNIEILHIKTPIIKFNVTCSKGTYMRSLCFDIGEKLGCGAMMNNLKRISSSSFHIAESTELYEINEENIKNKIITIDKALEKYDEIIVDDKFIKLLCNGVHVKDKSLTSLIMPDKLLKVLTSDKKLIGLGLKSKDEFKIVNLLI